MTALLQPPSAPAVSVPCTTCGRTGLWAPTLPEVGVVHTDGEFCELPPRDNTTTNRRP